eukprot:SAG22_NODE_8972_length_617_cov_1.667954_3_plen_88_part_01
MDNGCAWMVAALAAGPRRAATGVWPRWIDRPGERQRERVVSTMLRTLVLACCLFVLLQCVLYSGVERIWTLSIRMISCITVATRHACS